jgi:hypothetical protein
VVVSYRSYTISTHFGVGIGECYASGVNLIDHITLPDGSKYWFAYEGTNGQPCTGSCDTVTGRIGYIQLPSGSQVTFTYGTAGNSMMKDGSPAYMTRTLDSGQWTYTRAFQNGTSQPTITTVFDPAGNETDLNFSGVYQTAATAYQGRSPGTVLDYSTTCYNANYNGSQGQCASATVTPPITRHDVYDNPSQGSLQSIVDDIYDAYGNLTAEYLYDYGTSSHALLNHKVITYSASLCSGSKHICNYPTSVQILDGGANQKALTSYTPDGNGNTLEVSKWASPTSSLNSFYTYNTSGTFTGGTLATAKDPNSTITTYSYNNSICNGAFPTSVSVPSDASGNLTTSYTYDTGCNGAVVTSVTDSNNAATSTAYTDLYFWRPHTTTDALGNVTTYNYVSLTELESVMSFSNGNSGTSTQDNLLMLDGLGRTSLQQVREGPSSPSYRHSSVLIRLNGQAANAKPAVCQFRVEWRK